MAQRNNRTAVIMGWRRKRKIRKYTPHFRKFRKRVQITRNEHCIEIACFLYGRHGVAPCIASLLAGSLSKVTSRLARSLDTRIVKEAARFIVVYMEM